MPPSTSPEIWYITGSQHLYGPVALRQVAANSQSIVQELNASGKLPYPLVFKPILTSPEEIRALCLEANSAPNCAGLILWMHTFSPSKMWITGLSSLSKPFLHLHTQFNRDLPWADIDMDFMNLNQAAHGDREAGFIHTRLRLRRKVVVGHWSDPQVQDSVASWMRVAAAWHDWQGAAFARFGDNMRFVAVTEGDKVAAEARFGYSVNGYGIGDLAERIDAASDARVNALCVEYQQVYDVAPELRTGGLRHASLREGARIEIGLRDFLTEGGFKGFTTTFEMLHGLKQLPGLAVQRLMADGYGFGAEGDWKTCALLRAMKVMAGNKATSFMEDYTYHLDPAGHLVLGSHMLEVCPSLTSSRPRLEIHPLSIGNREDPVRLVFSADPGPGVVVALTDVRDRFRLVANVVEAIPPAEPLPKLPVGRAVWRPAPNFQTSATCWLTAGAAHHTAMSTAVGIEAFEDYARLARTELLIIDQATTLRAFENDLRWNAAYYRLARGI